MSSKHLSLLSRAEVELELARLELELRRRREAGDPVTDWLQAQSARLIGHAPAELHELIAARVERELAPRASRHAPAGRELDRDDAVA